MSLLKKTRNDAIKAAVCSYLERRNYPETDIFNNKNASSQSAEQMAVTSIVQCEASRANSILFSSINNDSGQYDIQYTRLVNFIKDLKNEKIKSELLGLLSPLLCHMYLEMLRGGHGGAAQVFLKRHAATLPQKDLSFHQHIDNLPSALYRPNSLEQLFNSLQNGTIDNETTPENDYINQILDNIGTVFTLQEIETKPSIAAFRSNKYDVFLSQDTLNTLKAYLAKHGHVLLIQVLQTWFHIDISDDPKNMKDDDEEEMGEDTKYQHNNIYPNSYDDFREEAKVAFGNCNVPNGECDAARYHTVGKELSDLQEAIKGVRDSHAPLKLYKIAAPDTHLICAKTDRYCSLLVSGFSNSEIRLWDLGQRSIKKRVNKNISEIEIACNMPDDEPPEDTSLQIGTGLALRGHSGPVHGISILAKEKLLLSVSEDSTMRAWRLSDYSCAAIYKGHSYPIWCMDVSASGLFIATGSNDKTVKLWSLNRTFPARLFVGHTADVTCVKFHPNDLYLATGSADRSVRMWTVCDARLVRVLWHRGLVRALAFSPFGSYLASAGDDKKIKVWDLAASSCIHEYKGHNGKITALDWSSVGKANLTNSIVKDASDSFLPNSLLCSTGMDGIVRVVWDSHCRNKQSPNQDFVSSTYNTKCSYLVDVQVHEDWVVAIGTKR